MTNRVKEFFVSFDVFGSPISVNYKGLTSFQTATGAFFTLVIKSFILAFAVEQMTALVSYKNPQIAQVSLQW